MKKGLKKLICFATAATLSAGALSLAGCGVKFTPVAKDEGTTVTSNGGFVVSTNDYYYFINGVETHTSDNTYGSVVKGALMRVKKADKFTNASAETVIPSLMVAGDKTSGIYLYNGRIYYATPTSAKNTSGEVENTYLDFKSAKTDGSDVKSIARVSENSVTYRYVKAGDNNTVYLVYKQGEKLHSVNTDTKDDVVLVDGGEYVFNKDNVEDPYVYYTMKVKDKQDTASPITDIKYNQVYRVRADQTKSFYTYTWDSKYLEEHDNEAPYVNNGEIVLDGIGSTDSVTQFNHHTEGTTLPAIGYVYTLQSYCNDGVYFTRKQTSAPGSTVGTTGELYYLPTSALTSSWNSVSGNGASVLDTVANAVDADAISGASPIYYIQEGNGYKHHYLYVDGEYIYRADVKTSDATADLTEVAYDVSGATLVKRVPATGANAYENYVYYTLSGTSGKKIGRAVYGGTEEDYRNLQKPTSDGELYAPVTLLSLEHASNWYDFEILDNVLFFANAESFGGNSYSYTYTFDLEKSAGTVMNNKEVKALNEKYDSVMGDEGYRGKVNDDVSAKAATAIKYYFYTGKTAQFYENIDFSVKEGGKTANYLYSEKDVEAFEKFTATDFAEFKDAKGDYRTLSYFITRLGKVNEADEESFAEYWKTTLEHYELPEEEKTGLAWWAWTLIGVGIALVVAAAVVVPIVVVKKRKKAQAPKREKLRVDTTDDKSVDVYTDAEKAPEEEADEPEEEPVEEAEEEAEAVEESDEADEAEPSESTDNE